MFRLIDLTTNEYLGNERTSLSYPDGKRAARASKLASYVLNRKVQVRRAQTGDENWRERERSRFTSGDYTPLEPGLASYVREYYPDHYAHVAKKRPDLIAYTKSEDKGRDDKQSLISVKAYVELVGKHPDLEWPGYRIERLVRNQLTYAGICEKEYTLATTPDDIARVYIEYDGAASQVSSSCMRYGEGHWPRVDGARFHPARVYGAGDLAIAYISNDDGRTVARAIVWPDKKIYSRVYADNDHLHRLLKRDGYKQSRYYDSDNDSIEGARLLRVENDDGNLVCPYVDECDTVSDDGEYLILDGGDYTTQNTSGYIKLQPEYTCEHCGDGMDEDDSRTVYVDARRNHPEQWCSHCAENDTFYCEGTSEYYSQRVDHTYIDDVGYTDRYLENNANWCERREEYTFDDLTTVIVNDDGGTQMWSEQAVDNHAYEWDGVFYSDDIESVKVVTQRYVKRVGGFKWYSTRDTADGGRIYGHQYATNVWFVDNVERVPEHLLDDDIMVGLDGRRYLRGYKDNFPLDRPRMDVDLLNYEFKEAA